MIGAGEGERCFRRACEIQHAGTIWELRKVIDGIFGSVLAFYRFNRGAGQKARDVSTFFKLAKLHTEFNAFWDSKENAVRRAAIEDRIQKFELALDDEGLAL